MDYPLESLNPDSFQELVQALLIGEFPGLQCFPVGQADGGRDAGAHSQTEKIIFQVKFSRSPTTVKNPTKWLTDTIRNEKESIDRLIDAGASRYILITNVKGTSKWESGSIDKVSKFLAENLSIPAQCFWRDDVLRRIDAAPNVRWAYPQLLGGLDAIQVLLEQNSEDGKRRSRAISVYLAKQFEKDNSVRFKQVDLQNDILSLFIDVPIYTGADSEFSNDSYSRQNRIINTLISKSEKNHVQRKIGTSDGDDYLFAIDQRRQIGAATFFLNNLVQEEEPFVVLEGGPGQGKSTLTQYICQVHRAKLLNKIYFLNKVEDNHNEQSTRLPFRIDLRDLAVWLDGRNPFIVEKQSEKSGPEKRSVENFLAHHISYETGGIDFSVNDFFTIISKSHLIVIFDGLDEVPDFERRKLVVSEIQDSISRMEQETLSLQSIVTSRPAALSNAPGLPEDSFPVFVLDSVTPDLADEYAKNWAAAKKLPERDTKDLLKTLSEKLQQPHLVDLARNPMQLTILLTLILSRGSSLPDKRTALYDQYVELFFNREAEKSTTVRDQRDLIISIHRYIAWHLHTLAETGGEGRIKEDELIDALKKYLKVQGYEPHLAELLFSGIVERVVFLVSRVQGTFEFEVQPLREYFVGRYLYETAAYSPPGMESKGTLPDRFDGLSRNFYWFNVVRFFSGCYSVGELPSLIDCIDNLMDDPNYKNIGYTRALCVSLLSDWVFSQHPRSMKKVVDLISRDNGVKLLIASSRFGNNPFYDELRLPEKCGRTELVEFCDRELKSENKFDYECGLSEIIRVNKKRADFADYWYDLILKSNSDSSDRLFRICRNSGILEAFTIDQLKNIEKRLSDSVEFYDALAESGHFDYIYSNEENLTELIEKFLSSSAKLRIMPRATDILELFFGYYKAGIISFMKEKDDPNAEHYSDPSIRQYIIDNFEFEKLPRKDGDLNSDIMQKILRNLEKLNTAIKGPVEAWHVNLENFNSIIESLREDFGEVWKAYEFSLVTLDLSIEDVECEFYTDVFDETLPLANRVYASKRHSEDPEWLKSSIAGAKSPEQMSLISLIAIKALENKTEDFPFSELDLLIQKLSNWSLSKTLQSTSILKLKSDYEKRNKEESEYSLIHNQKDFDRLSIRSKIILSDYLNTRQKVQIITEINSGYTVSIPEESRVILRILYELLGKDLSDHEESLIISLIKEYYMDGFDTDQILIHSLVEGSRDSSMISENAMNTILSDIKNFPIEIVSIAEARKRNATAGAIQTLEEISSKKEWFHQGI